MDDDCQRVRDVRVRFCKGANRNACALVDILVGDSLAGFGNFVDVFPFFIQKAGKNEQNAKNTKRKQRIVSLFGAINEINSKYR